MRRLPGGLILSLVVHGALLLGVVATLGETAPRALFVDLVHGLGRAAGSGSGGGGSSGAGTSSERPVARSSFPARQRPVANETKVPDARVPAPLPAPEPPHASVPHEVIVEPVPPPAASVPAPSPAAPPATAGAPAARERAGSSAAGTGVSDAGGGARGARLGQGGTGSGGGLGAGIGARQGSAVALAVPGDGAGAPPEYEGYYALLRSRLHEAIRYPGAARRRGITGTVEIEVRVGLTGEIESAKVVASSSHSLLDEAALDATRGLRVPFPAGLRPRPLSMRLPVEFSLR